MILSKDNEKGFLAAFGREQFVNVAAPDFRQIGPADEHLRRPVRPRLADLGDELLADQLSGDEAAQREGLAADRASPQ